MAVTDGTPALTPVSLPFQRETRRTIRQRVGRLLGEYTADTVLTAGPANFSSAMIARYPDNRFRGWTVFISSGTGSGQSRVISDSSQSLASASVIPGWDTTPDATSRLEMWKGDHTPEEINESINLALLDAGKTCLVPARDNPAAISTDSKRLTVPPSLSYVSRVVYESVAQPNTFYEYGMVQSPSYIQERQYGVALVGHYLYTKLPLPPDLPLSKIWIYGYRYPALMYNDDDLAEVRPDFLTYMAAFYSDASLAEGSMLDPAEHSGRAGNWLRLAMSIKGTMGNYVEPGTQEVGP